MTWVKTSDDHPDHRLDLSDAAYRLEHAALSYSNRLHLDGRIPKAHLEKLPVPAPCGAPAILAELVDRGIWTDDGDAYSLVEYFADQPSRDEVLTSRAWAKLRQRLARADQADKPGLRAACDAAKEAHRRAVADREARAESLRDTRREARLSRSDGMAPSRSDTLDLSLRPDPSENDSLTEGESLAREGSGPRRQSATKSPTLAALSFDRPSPAAASEHSRSEGPTDLVAEARRIFADDLVDPPTLSQEQLRWPGATAEAHVDDPAFDAAWQRAEASQ